jgi:hypothetical protein
MVRQNTDSGCQNGCFEHGVPSAIETPEVTVSASVEDVAIQLVAGRARAMFNDLEFLPMA